jgi:hypothetical protein
MLRKGYSTQGNEHFAMAKHPDPRHQLADRVTELRMALQNRDPAILADHSGATYFPTGSGVGEFRLSVWGCATSLIFPGLVAFDANTGDELPTYLQALILYYFTTCDGKHPEGRWISFSELPDGRFYNQAFQGYTGKELARAFGDDLISFQLAAQSAGGETASGAATGLGDASFSFRALPRVPLLAAYWLGDEDFPASCQILFDAAISHHLPTDACAILGSTLVRRLLKAKGKTP